MAAKISASDALHGAGTYASLETCQRICEHCTLQMCDCMLLVESCYEFCRQGCNVSIQCPANCWINLAGGLKKSFRFRQEFLCGVQPCLPKTRTMPAHTGE